MSDAPMSDLDMSDLDRLCRRHGITLAYQDQLGHRRVASDEVKRALLEAIGVPAGDEAAVARALESAPAEPDGSLAVDETRRCFLPETLRDDRVWGVALQLYQLRGADDWGIGDFETLARAAELAAGWGADFVGVNPLHALFLAEPAHCSPFSPSNRRFLNPLYLSVAAVPGYEAGLLDEAERARLQAAELVDYPGVARLKLGVLRRLWERWPETAADAEAAAFAAFRTEEGEALERQALFEALSAHFKAEGRSAGWHGWPEEFRDPESPAVAAFAAGSRSAVDFQAWLQWLADRQLAAAQARAKAAGMAIGLYLDLAVGDAPDGAATWSDQTLMVTGARIGAPPDSFNIGGQDWGLSPLSPAVLRQRALAPYRAILGDVMRHAGALRLDHAMGLRQLFFIPGGHPATEGTYLAYPFSDMLAALAAASRDCGTVIIGEDLGTVPEGFREMMAEAEIQSYRLLYFERLEQGLKPPESYPRQALACLSTHDLPPLFGWWHGDDVALQRRLGFMDEAMAEAETWRRRDDQRRLLASLQVEGLLDPVQVEALAADGSPAGSPALEALSAALHRHLARAPSRLFAVRLEDLAGEHLAVNVPGTVDEHPNWQRRLGVALEELAETPLFQAIARGVAAERPKRRAAAMTPTPPRLPFPPTATYRLQFREGMTFERAAALAPYWRRLGISHLYASPVFAAAAGSTHGYDVADFSRLEPALGGEAGFRAMAAALREQGIGLILDFVPNHMSATTDNPWWRALLEWGEASPTAGFFDIDWSADKLLIPTLGAPYAEILEAGELAFDLDVESARLWLRYHETALPLGPASSALLLARSGDPALQGLASRLASATPNDHADLLDELRDLLAEDERARAFRQVLAELSAERETVHEVHEAQFWRLAYWRAGRDSLTYRRFFEITGLVGLRVEDPAVFDAVHALLLALADEDLVQGVRLDHIDGLADPAGYLDRLAGALPDDCYLVVEKILEGEERLPRRWPVEGTTGYEFIAALAQGLCDEPGLAGLDEAYGAFIGRAPDLEAETEAAKQQILTENLASELATLTRQAGSLAERQLAARDFGEDSLRRALTALMLAFPVYRSYVDADGAAPADRRLIEAAAERARRQPDIEETHTLDFIVSLLLLDVPDQDRDDALGFVVRFQQTTGPIMAKALEDTLFYRHHRLIALNEVGGDPGLAEASAEAFHRAMAERLDDQPHGLSATATHDTKRGEDARARLYALSEAPGLWSDSVARWSATTAGLRGGTDEAPAPEPETEWLVYQALLGAWPAALAADDTAGLEAFGKRLAAFLEKALREAKLHTRWTAPDEAYESGVLGFAAGLLGPEGRAFREDFLATGEPFLRAGVVNSLAQSLLKLTVPGVPDLYQGSEGWDLSLVDPDNRRPVDFEALSARLEDLEQTPPEALLADWRSGAVKQRVLAAGLAARRARPRLFDEGDYRPLEVAGAQAGRVIAFARLRGEEAAVTVVPRRPLAILDPRLPTIPPDAWEDTAVVLPDALRDRPLRDALSDGSGRGDLRLSDRLAALPVGLFLVD